MNLVLVMLFAAELLTRASARPKQVPPQACRSTTHGGQMRMIRCRKPKYYACGDELGRRGTPAWPEPYNHDCVSARGCWSRCRNATATDADVIGPPRVVAIVATCNRPNSLLDAVASVLAQTVPAFEILVSIDSGAKCVASVDNVWPGGKVKVLKRPGYDVTTEAERGRGGARARMHAIEHSHQDTTHFAFLDDDDVWLPTKLEIQLAAMANKTDAPTVLVSSDALYPAKHEAARCRDRDGALREYVPWPLFHNATESGWFRPWNRGLYLKGLTKSFGGEALRRMPRAAPSSMRFCAEPCVPNP